MSYSPVLTKLRFLLLAAGAIAETGNSTIGFTYGGDGQANGADQSIGSTQEGGIECTVNSGPASYMGLSTSNTSQDETSWQYGIQWYAGTSYYIIENGSTLGAPNGVGQAAVPAAGDKIRLRKVGVGSTAEVLAELLPNGGSAWVIIYKFATKATVTLYPALRTYVGSESMGPMILQIGQAQARVPYNQHKVLGEGDSLQALQFLYLQDMAPFVGTGTTFVDLSVAGSQFTTLDSRVAALNAAYDAAKTMGLLTTCGTNDYAVGLKSSSTIRSDANTWLGHITGTYAWKAWEKMIPRAGSFSGQPAINAGNAGLVTINGDFVTNRAAIGFTDIIDRRPTGGVFDYPAYAQSNFETPVLWYSLANWQEAWSPGPIHPEQRLAQIEAELVSVYLSALLVPDAAALAGAGRATATGSGSLTTRVALSGAGVTKASGAGALTVKAAFSGAGGAVASGSGNLTVKAVLAGSGTTSATGTGALSTGSSGAALSGSGQAGASGTAALTVKAAFAGAGATPTQGAGALTTRVLLSGGGTLFTSGSGTLSQGGAAVALAGSGQASASGSGALTVQAALAGGGFTITTGAGALSIGGSGVSFAASGQAATSGTGSLTTRAALSGGGFSIVTGSGVLSIGNGGVAFVGNGQANSSGTGLMTLRAALSGAGQTSARGSGALSVPSTWLDGNNEVVRIAARSRFLTLAKR